MPFLLIIIISYFCAVFKDTQKATFYKEKYFFLFASPSLFVCLFFKDAQSWNK